MPATCNLSKLKSLWPTLTETNRAFWRQELLSPLRTAIDLRHLIHQKLKIKLEHDSQLYEFRQWDLAQRPHAALEDHLLRQTRTLVRKYPKWDADKIHGELLKQICLQTAFDANDATALKAVRAAARIWTLDLQQKKFKESLRTKIRAGLDAIKREAGRNRILQAAVQNLCEAIGTELPRK